MPPVTKKTYAKPKLEKLGLLRQVTRFSNDHRGGGNPRKPSKPSKPPKRKW